MIHRKQLGILLSLAPLFAVCGAGCAVPPESDDEGEADVSPYEYGDEAPKPLTYTGFTSEEYPPIHCSGQRLVGGAECTGSYCDNMAFDCLPVNATLGSSSWTTYFSEEGTNSRICGNKQWVTGLSCKGKYCDNISLQCTQITGRGVGACYWSGSFSEEDGPYTAPPGHFIRGAKCTGSYCDNLSYYYCKLN